jgi:hypothetical protein
MDTMKFTENIMFVRLSHGLPRQSRKVKAAVVPNPQMTIDQLVEKNPRATGDMAGRLKASAKLYSGSAFGAIKSFDADTRAALVRLAIDIPACFRGSYVLPRILVERVTKFLETRAEGREQLVLAFLSDAYENEITQARIDLGEAFRKSDFPPASVLRNSFICTWSLFQMNVPGTGIGISDAVRQREEEKFGAQMNSVFAQCRDALRETMADLVGHLADRLVPDADGNRKRLCASTIEQLREFLDTVNARDITSDEQIQTLSNQARDILKNYGAEDLKQNATSERVKAGLDAIKNELGTLITRDGARKIDLDVD